MAPYEYPDRDKGELSLGRPINIDTFDLMQNTMTHKRICNNHSYVMWNGAPWGIVS